ncbi:enoyl-CoA hydratase/isomerase family protein [Actinomycetospora sp. TBRC 11914]|uniref:enoyl-CoA hydratase/isomerase family protein n=1 Tax=Actinomycetospora sp. TBRC 11914 TaxID=2729387 RepID=UPI00145C9A83|nr:enoyl-CoA hydratase/isomerase family protein [Actinomycetospora sp. TBRC 11914]NMO93135.1 enoyl-CoA hydratase/isomerase family protein [Actinomycetospora sp. TBRC 11914]
MSAPPTTAPVHTSVDGPVARIVLDTGDGNTLTYAAMTAFVDALEAARDSGATVLVVAGAGGDLTVGRAKHEQVPGVTRQENLSLILRANEALSAFPGISVAVVRGRALGFGTGLALHADLALAADTAVLGFDELAHGLPPLVVLTYLYRHVAPKVADDLVLTGRRVGAAEARDLGLVSRVVAEPDLEAVVERTVAELAGRDPSALRLLKDVGREHKATAPTRAAGDDAVARLVAWIENRTGARA